MTDSTSDSDQLSQLLQQWQSSGRRLSPQELSRLEEAIANAKADAALQRFVAETQLDDSPAPPPPPGATIPSQIGQYRIVSALGHGGMGTVYQAEQDWPKRTIALKILSPGLMTESMRQRFRWEADVLARLEHPGIAKIYEAGVAQTAGGPKPFFAMELVDGVRLDEYIKQHSPPLKARLQLLIDIGQAVHHAHTKGVIHRDLKPGNILVTRDGKPKVLDFGVARAIDSDIQATTLHTESGQLVGTLPYMAPEQAAGKVNELDTSSDVYALGVIAYEILSGKMPYLLSGKALHEVVRVICEEEPSRLSSVDRNLRGDVETIVQKAMAKEKSRRYATAGELAADVKRFLDYEPITARPPSTWYNLKRFAKRNKLVVSAAALLFLTLAGGAITSTYFAISATREKQEARSQADIATATNEFLTNRVLAGATPERLPDKSVRDAIVKAMLDPAAVAVAQDFKNTPLTEAAVRNSLALSYYSIGRADLALPHAEAALERRRRALGDDHPDTLLAIDTIGHVLQARGELEQAEPLYREALEGYRRLRGDNHPDTLGSISAMGVLLQARGKLEQAEPLLRDALQRYRRVLGDDHPETLVAINNLGSVLRAQGKLDDAEPLYREALERFRRVLGNDNPNTLHSISNMGALFGSQGKLDQNELLYREVLERRRRVLGDDHPDTLTSINNMGGLFQDQGKLDQTEPLYREALERRRRVLGDDHPDTLNSMNNMGGLLKDQGKLDQAEPLYRESLERSRRVLGDDHPDTMLAINNLGGVLARQRKLDQAEPLWREAIERRRRVLGDDHPETLESINNMGFLLQAQGNLVQAEPLKREALERYRRVLGDDHPHTLVAINNLGSLLQAQGKLNEAEPLFLEMVTKAKTNPNLGPKHPYTKAFATNYAECLDDLARHDEAAAVRKEFGLSDPSTQPATMPATAPATQPT